MAISRLILAGVLILLLLAASAGCTDLQPTERQTGVQTPSPADRVREAPTPEAQPAPIVPPEPSAGRTTFSLVKPALEQPGPLVPVPGPTPIAKTFQVEPLAEVTGDQWESYATWPQYPFEYRSLGYTIWVPYNSADYEQEKKSLHTRNEDRTRFLAQLYTVSNDWWYLALPLPGQEVYYRDLINDPANDLPYESILSTLRKIRDEQGLDDNEYAELIARFVQRAVPDRSWETDGRVVERYPIETIGDFGGNRIDKSLLLAGLLAREGYGVALIYFPDVNGMLVGIRGDERALEYDGYLGIDPSTETFFGVYAPKVAPVIPAVQYFADYRLIEVSEGRRFTAGGELRIIWDRLTFMYFYETLRDYTKDLRFVRTNRDNRHLVFEYMAWLGQFGYE